MINTAVKKGETKDQYRERIFAEMKAERRRKRRQLSRGEIPVVMDVDDFGFLLPGYDDLLRLKKSFPGFKITCFTIPLPGQFYHPENAKHFSMEKYRKWAEIVNQCDWIEVAFHGFSHVHNELETGYDKAIKTIEAAENLWDQIGLKYSRIYKAPYWQYSYDALVALRDKGYIIAVDRNHQRPLPPGSKSYIFNWSFEEPLPEEALIKGHGHFVGQNKNNISDTLHNILHCLPQDTHFMTITDHIMEERKKTSGDATVVTTLSDNQ